MTVTDTDSLQSGIAVLQDTPDPFAGDPPYPVSGIAMPAGITTHGGSGLEREWPAETLREAADLLVGKSIVQDFHPATREQAPASAIIGQITDAGYSDSTGLEFRGEITDQEAAQKIDRGYLEVSVRPAIGEERTDPRSGGRVVESIADFLDIALVDQGAADGNSIAVGDNPSIAALSQRWLSDSTMFDALQDTTVSDPEYNGYSTAEWSAPSLDGTFDGDMDAARDSATLIRDGGEDFGDLSLFVVDGDGDLNLNALDSAWQMASSTDDVSEDEVSRLRSMYEGLAEQARESGSMPDSMWEDDWANRVDDNATEANAGLRSALERDLELTGSSPDRCKTIKDGAATVDTDVAYDLLGVSPSRDRTPSGPVNIHEDALARQIVGQGRDENSRTVRAFKPDGGTGMTLDAAATRHVLDLETDALQSEGDRVRWDSDAGSEAEPSSVRYGIVINELVDRGDDSVLVAVYAPDTESGEWEATGSEETLSTSSLTAIEQFPPISQVS